MRLGSSKLLPNPCLDAPPPTNPPGAGSPAHLLVSSRKLCSRVRRVMPAGIAAIALLDALKSMRLLQPPGCVKGRRG